MADSLTFGSAAWMSGEEYGGEYAVRIKQFINKIDEKALLSYASSLRGEQPCTISPEFSVGSFNLVHKIQFNDGVEWVARLQMPPIRDGGSVMVSPATQERMILDMQSELATMEFVRQNTGITIPRVYAYDLNGQNDVGCPFSIIEYVDGNTAEEVSRNYPGEHEGIPAQFEEKLVETGTGPHNTAAEFYADYPLALSRSLGEQPVSGQDELMQAFRSLAASFPSDGSGEGFGLANYDLNLNNILVDREFNVLTVIDWDFVVSVPDAALYRFPFLMGVSCAVPGVVDAHSKVIKQEQLRRRFAEVVEEVAQQQAGKDCEGANKLHKHLFTRSGFFSKEAVAFRSLIRVKMRQDWVNDTWLRGLKWLSQHDEMQVAQFYLPG
ncbi:Protein kinase-like domain protein [Cordyceps fumosorosea ARSEF 2679]|uniref:Protein kinase-like domain protein n=1 Tax=Cordyceps fumosorosea (strain ARSEF 2679) TaxID=1081104 RepID=A0A167PNN0_CORFA|nr:Protein kinase-like domain protein [Cordyceps fumosorosea ARSEF 2679]OAA56859.1 Protein kinase-like domain protein [Cordyceps fumosorosea ARSEF 2679]